MICNAFYCVKHFTNSRAKTTAGWKQIKYLMFKVDALSQTRLNIVCAYFTNKFYALVIRISFDLDEDASPENIREHEQDKNKGINSLTQNC